MANLPNFLGAPLIDSPFVDIGGDIGRGLQIGAMPAQMRRKAEAENLANELSKIKMPYVEQQLIDEQLQRQLANELSQISMPFTQQRLLDEQLHRQLSNQQMQREYDYPGLGAKDPVLQALALSEYLKSKNNPMTTNDNQSNLFANNAELDNAYVPNNDAANVFDNYALQLFNDKLAQIKRHQQLVNSNEWQSMPANAKEHAIGMANQIGIAPNEFIADAVQGKSLAQQALEKKGITQEQLSEFEPLYLATTANVTAQKQRDAFNREINVLEKEVTKAMAPFARTLLGYSPQQIVSAISNENPDAQARYLAARALQPELTTLRIAAAGGSISQQSIENMMEKSLGNSKIYNVLVSPEVYEKTQEYITDWLNLGVNAARKSMYSINNNVESNQNNESELRPRNSSKNKMYRIRDEYGNVQIVTPEHFEKMNKKDKR